MFPFCIERRLHAWTRRRKKGRVKVVNAIFFWRHFISPYMYISERDGRNLSVIQQLWRNAGFASETFLLFCLFEYANMSKFTDTWPAKS